MCPILRSRFALWVAAALALLLGACVHGGQPAAGSTPGASASQPASSPAPTAAPAPPASPTAPPAKSPAPLPSDLPPQFAAQVHAAEGGGPVTLQPPDGKWLRDEQGRDYFVYEVEKPKRYTWLNPEHTRVELPMGGTYDVIGETPHSFRVKIYNSASIPVAGAYGDPAKAPDPEVIARSYAIEAGTTHRVHLEDFGQGLPTSGQWRGGFRLVDMNGDGHLDVVASPVRKGASFPSIFLGDGKGHFTQWKGLHFPRAAGEYDYGDVAVADFNGDGLPDIALACHLRGLVVLINDGHGGFKEWGQGLPFEVPGRGGASTGFTSRAIAAVDWNGDGKPDIVALGEGPNMVVPTGSMQGLAGPRSYSMRVYLNRGDGTWETRKGPPSDGNDFGDSLAVADFNGDGLPDAALGLRALGRVSILRLSDKSRWPDNRDWSAVRLNELRPNSYTFAVAARDLNGDGRPDLVVGYLSFEAGQYRTGIDVQLNLGGGRWQRRPLWNELGRRGVFAVGIGDVDGDGKPDIVGIAADGEVMLFLGNASGFFDRETEIGLHGDRCAPFHIELADLDGDGRDEIVANFASEASDTVCRTQGRIAAWKAHREGDAPR